uniref:Uncharacterized protein n=1 Tax=Chromera velia CCMP2878 TaxID=1169474 RepID=A0A0G4GVM5_9ALVE|eukprot:Cvel_23575.t1-p1 / transcript=Cvel_23575.t1 / gene=Cvel_23575 / organism=Chromera_velia_CCMP2878 / gene_product=hypothetical protein / transcript_product=hypothetical protein / location=Cvel_scaffold2445:18675-20907(-) / protein_length=368 / sequence_SO=supercontig / SO=protein_coding / is_pseudo=false
MERPVETQESDSESLCSNDSWYREKRREEDFVRQRQDENENIKRRRLELLEEGRREREAYHGYEYNGNGASYREYMSSEAKIANILHSNPNWTYEEESSDEEVEEEWEVEKRLAAEEERRRFVENHTRYMERLALLEEAAQARNDRMYYPGQEANGNGASYLKYITGFPRIANLLPSRPENGMGHATASASGLSGAPNPSPSSPSPSASATVGDAAAAASGLPGAPNPSPSSPSPSASATVGDAAAAASGLPGAPNPSPSSPLPSASATVGDAAAAASGLPGAPNPSPSPPSPSSSPAGEAPVQPNQPPSTRTGTKKETGRLSNPVTHSDPIADALSESSDLQKASDDGSDSSEKGGGEGAGVLEDLL